MIVIYTLVYHYSKSYNIHLLLKYGFKYLNFVQLDSFFIPKSLNLLINASLKWHMWKHMHILWEKLQKTFHMFQHMHIIKCFWGLIKLCCHLIRRVTKIYGPITCRSAKLWSNTTIFINSINFFYKDYHITSSSCNDQITPYDSYIRPL